MNKCSIKNCNDKWLHIKNIAHCIQTFMFLPFTDFFPPGVKDVFGIDWDSWAQYLLNPSYSPVYETWFKDYMYTHYHKLDVKSLLLTPTGGNDHYTPCYERVGWNETIPRVGFNLTIIFSKDDIWGKVMESMKEVL